MIKPPLKGTDRHHQLTWGPNVEKGRKIEVDLGKDKPFFGNCY